VQRNVDANTFSRGTVDRILSMFLPDAFEASIGGEGIGTTATGAAVLISGKRALTYEGDWDRNFTELGVFLGLIFVGLRVSFATWLGVIGLRAVAKGNATALLLASFASPAIFSNQITMHTAYAHLAWFAAGLTMAAARPSLLLKKHTSNAPNDSSELRRVRATVR
jgi:hypothetical protein